MRTRLLITLCLALALLVDVASGHGGSFRGPNGGIPPGGRDPSDPEPPPSPPSDPSPPSGPITPGEPGTGPVTPPEGRAETPKEPAPPAPTPTGGRSRPAKTKTPLTFESWRYWWAYNSADILNVKTHLRDKGVSSSSPFALGTSHDRTNRANALRPTQRSIDRMILPALLNCINRSGDHEDIHGGAVIAVGKAGSGRYINLFEAILTGTYRTDKGKRIEFGQQATESAALALGLLRNLDGAQRDAVRRACLEALGNDKLRRRDRVWAAVSLGLQRDEKAVEPLVEALKRRYADDNIPCGILAALGLIGSEKVLDDLHLALSKGRLYGRDIRNNMRLRAFAGYAIGKIGKPDASLPVIHRMLGSRGLGRIAKRSAAIAAGVLGAKADDKLKQKTVGALLRYIRGSSGDNSGVNFALIALSQIGTDTALRKLLDFAEDGKYSQRPFAGLGLATHVWYADRAYEMKRGEPMAPAMRTRIVEKLRELSEKYRDADTRAAFLLCRGLVRDRTVRDELVRVAAKRGNATLRGYACVALGLLGDASDDVRDAMRLALRERGNDDLRRNAAVGLGLLHDSKVVDLLLKELERAKSFAVKGQLITAIGTIGDQRAVGPLVRLLEDKRQPTQTRAMAAVGLGMIGDLAELPTLSRIAKNYNYRASVGDMDELLFIL